MILLYGYPTMGVKAPQKDNPMFWRVKYITGTTMHQMQQTAGIEYGGAVDTLDRSSILGPEGFQKHENGIRYDIDNYKDLVC